jgi:uncharacterized membrane protein (DUF485 family)
MHQSHGREGVKKMAPNQTDRATIAKNPRFVELHRRKCLFFFGWWSFSTVYYLFLPMGAGGSPEPFRLKIAGDLNLRCLFVLSQFVICWAIAVLYLVWSNSVSDEITNELPEEIRTGELDA